MVLVRRPLDKLGGVKIRIAAIAVTTCIAFIVFIITLTIALIEKAQKFGMRISNFDFLTELLHGFLPLKSDDLS